MHVCGVRGNSKSVVGFCSHRVCSVKRIIAGEFRKAQEIAVCGVDNGAVGTCKGGNLGIGDEIATGRSGSREEKQDAYRGRVDLTSNGAWAILCSNVSPTDLAN